MNREDIEKWRHSLRGLALDPKEADDLCDLALSALQPQGEPVAAQALQDLRNRWVRIAESHNFGDQLDGDFTLLDELIRGARIDYAAPPADGVEEVWAVATRTYQLLFATEDDANEFQRANGVGASTYVPPVRMPVLRMAAPKGGE